MKKRNYDSFFHFSFFLCDLCVLGGEICRLILGLFLLRSRWSVRLFAHFE